MLPASTRLSTSTSTGIDSPVTADTSRLDRPSTTTPSVATRSPAHTRIRSPTSTSAVGTATWAVPQRSRVVSGTSDSTARKPCRDRVTAHSSKASEIENKNASDAASPHCPNTTAPTSAIDINNPTPNRRRPNARTASGTKVAPPATIATTNAARPNPPQSANSRQTPISHAAADTDAAHTRQRPSACAASVDASLAAGAVPQQTSPITTVLTRRSHQRVRAQPDVVAGLGQQTFRRHQHVAQLRPGDRIEHLPPLGRTIDHQPALAQTRQMVRHIRLRRPHRRHQISHPLLTIEQSQQDPQPRRITQSVEQPGRDPDINLTRHTHDVSISIR